MEADLPVEHTRDYTELVKLYRIVYPGKNTNKFEWLYKDNPSGEADIYYVRDPESGAMIATYVIIPMKYWYQDRIITIGQGVDGMVHPDYRQLRVYNYLRRNTLKLVADKYEFLIGFPNSMAIRSVLHAGAKYFGPLVTYSFPMSSEFLIKRPTRRNFFNQSLSPLLTPAVGLYKAVKLWRINTAGYRLEPAGPDDIVTTDSYEKIKSSHSIMAVRDLEFLKWRFLAAPSRQYLYMQYFHDQTPMGYMVLRFEHRAVKVIDFCIDSSLENQLRAIKLLIKYCDKRLIKSMHFELSDSCYCVEALKKLGFIKRKGNYATIIFPFSDKAKQLEYSDFFLTFADTDWI
jgi:hypothetical protein